MILRRAFRRAQDKGGLVVQLTHSAQGHLCAKLSVWGDRRALWKPPRGLGDGEKAAWRVREPALSLARCSAKFWGTKLWVPP